MLTIISFLLTLIGSVNWLMIGLLQYDFIAGIFGFQSSALSRIVYIIIGASSAVLIFKLFKGKGTLSVLSRRNKRDVIDKLEKIGHRKTKEKEIPSTAYMNVESGKDSLDDIEIEDDFSSPEPQRPTSLFDEHFDDRGRL